MTLALLALALAAAAADAALLPADGEVVGWRRLEAARAYAGPELYELIDGGAEPFLELGFERVTVQQYANGSDEIGVELYAMRDATAALGIYLMRAGSETPASGFEERHTAGRHELLLVRNRFYAVVANLSGRAERAPALVAFARVLAGRLPPAEKAPLLDLLPSEGRVRGSERLIRGPLGLQSFILLGEGDVLQLAGRITGAAALYDGPQGRGTLLVVPYPDAASATEALAHLVANLDPEIRVVTRATDRLLFRDHAGTPGELRLDGARLRLTLGSGSH